MSRHEIRVEANRSSKHRPPILYQLTTRSRNVRSYCKPYRNQSWCQQQQCCRSPKCSPRLQGTDDNNSARVGFTYEVARLQKNSPAIALAPCQFRSSTPITKASSSGLGDCCLHLFKRTYPDFLASVPGPRWMGVPVTLNVYDLHDNSWIYWCGIGASSLKACNGAAPGCFSFSPCCTVYTA